MLHTKSFLAPILMGLLLTSCASISPNHDRQLKDCQAKNLEVQEKSPATAAWLNVLPGVGDFYNGNIGYGIANLLTWPYSILWAPVGGADGAKEVNYFATKAHVDELEHKKKKVTTDLEVAMMSGQISKNDFAIAMKKIDSMSLTEFQHNVNFHSLIPVSSGEAQRLPSSQK